MASFMNYTKVSAMAKQFKRNREFVEWIIESAKINPEGATIKQLYINGKSIVDTWDEPVRISVEYLVEELKNEN